MTLKSSEVKNFSWRIGTELKSFLVSSYFCHCALPLHQTNVQNAQNGSEDDLLISRIQSLHHLLEVDYHDEEEWSVSSTLDNRWKNNLVVQYRSKFFPNGYSFFVGVGFVRRPHLLVGGVHSVTTCPRGSGRAAGTAGDWRRVRRVGSWMDWKAQSRRVALTSCMDEPSANTRTI